MRLLKIIFVFFLIYFIRRFIQMYRTMKQIQDAQLKAHEDLLRRQKTAEQTQAGNVINADFKVVD
ncbi:hypothetical protein ACJVC5_15605 [Peredibacter sp. HCB2-198]|uniref:hypothetical protein n=1 Tax=Peredibacter sp. HCB2-198 TaxID=3383025 RepID=UPI0038B4B4C7